MKECDSGTPLPTRNHRGRRVRWSRPRLTRQIHGGRVAWIGGSIRMTSRPCAPIAAITAANTVASYRRTTTGLEHRPRGQPLLDRSGRSAHAYGSEGWGFESLRARPGQRTLPVPGRGLLVPLGPMLGATAAGAGRTVPGSWISSA